MAKRETVWVFGDQLNRAIGALATAAPATHRVLLVTAASKIASRPWHPARVALITRAIADFVADLRADGFEVDHQLAPSFRAGVEAHRAAHSPSRIVVTEPNSLSARRLVADLGCDSVRSNQFLCHPDDFQSWASTRKSFRMEDFYRWQRRRLGYLMDGDEPAGGEWNYDEQNRERPPKDGHGRWPTPANAWATTRKAALERLEFFVTRALPMFGPHEDAMLAKNWHLAHSVLSPYLNLGLLLPGEVCDRVEKEFRAGRVPINSAEGFIRQVIGWREYVWNLYWRWMPDYASLNALDADLDLPPLFTGAAQTSMRCVGGVLRDLQTRGWVHHIPRLMVLGNLALIAGVDPQQFTRWMWDSFVDSAEWVMVPNVIGMSLHADGGKMASKPYAAGGAYIDRMSDYCAGCAFDRSKRVGEDACPFTTLYWDFLLRHADRFVKNPRMSTQVRSAQKLRDAKAVRERAREVVARLRLGQL
ncbi:MAG: cryptochrome/photolyase family protein [Deltaproteobacteria bacterium]|nr:cryptochrome/photolyase family protein [Deltaproteobacteria bacterium]